MQPEIEISADLHHQSEAFAEWLGISLSQLYTNALTEYLHYHQQDIPSLHSLPTHTVWVTVKENHAHTD
jgi:hypothetical protein